MAKNTKVLKQAKLLRQRMTPAEKILWQELRNKKLGVKFRRQMPFVFGIYRYVADFYCPQRKLIIEIDGGVHNDPEVKEIDIFREDIFKLSGYKIIRFKNKEVEYTIKGVIERIKEATSPGPLRPLPPAPSPSQERGRTTSPAASSCPTSPLTPLLNRRGEPNSPPI